MHEVLYIENRSFLSIKHGCLQIENKESKETVRLAWDDVRCIILDNEQISLTSAVLSRAAEHKVAIISSDKVHLPIGLYLPLTGSSRKLQVYKHQTALSKVQKKQLWQKIIRQKIQNQAEVLNHLKGDKSLFRYISEVKSDDSQNVEATAARVYWRALFGNKFTRGEDNALNGCLNYGYAIIRSFMARYLAAAGFFLPLGIHHKSELNAFNLVDDLIEPLRPLVDFHVSHLEQLQNEESLKLDHKKHLKALIKTDCQLEETVTNLMIALEIYAESYKREIMSEGKIILPSPYFSN